MINESHLQTVKHLEDITIDEQIELLARYYRHNGNVSLLVAETGISANRINKFVILLSKNKSIMAEVRLRLKK